ncbi:MAG: CRTAC1 family protein [Myxococcales bacterium]|nr:CRTAC1 family protein [Myxococcales bacterium]
MRSAGFALALGVSGGCTADDESVEVIGSVELLQPDSDIAETPGIVFEDHAALLAPDLRGALGVSLVDVDGDFWPDVSLGTDRGVRLLRNRTGESGGQLSFVDQTNVWGLGPLELGSVDGLVYGDLDADGDLDLILTRFTEADAVLTFDGHQFQNATEAWGFPGVPTFSQSASLADLDGDGDLDVFVATGVDVVERLDEPSESQGRPDLVYRNDGGRFTEVSKAWGLAGPQFGASFVGIIADFDEDGAEDIFSIHDFLRDTLFLGTAGGVFQNATETWVPNVATGLMGLDTGDIDGDGLLDLYATNFGADVLYLQRPAATPRFQDAMRAWLGDAANPTEALTGWGCALFDADNDGDLDVISVAASDGRFRPDDELGTGRQGRMILFENTLAAGTPGFVERTETAGAPFEGVINAFGVARGDLDRDGLEDIVVGAEAASTLPPDVRNTPFLLMNRSRATGHFLRLDLRDSAGPNTQAVGARVKLKHDGRQQHRVLTAGASFLSSHSGALHFGLGDSPATDIEIVWPNGERQSLPDGLEGEWLVERGAAPVPSPKQR